jgi:hypothetical protein
MKLETTPSQHRRSSLRAVANRIAWRLSEVSQPYTDRNEAAPAELLEKHFMQIISEREDLKGGPITPFECKLLAEKLVPKAVEKITRRLTRTNENISGLLDTLEARPM